MTELTLRGIWEDCKMTPAHPAMKTADLYEALEEVAEFLDLDESLLPTHQRAVDWAEATMMDLEEFGIDDLNFGAITLCSRIDTRWEPLYCAAVDYLEKTAEVLP